MIYFKKIEIDNFDIIQKKTLDFVNNNPFYLQPHNQELFQINWIEFCQDCPEIIDCCSKYEIKPTLGALHILPIGRAGTKIHIDSFSPKSRINIPIINYEDSSTEFFEGGKVVKEYRNIVPYNVEECVKVDEISSHIPYVIRTDKLHRVIRRKLDSIRIVLSIWMSRDPVFLLG